MNSTVYNINNHIQKSNNKNLNYTEKSDSNKAVKNGINKFRVSGKIMIINFSLPLFPLDGQCLSGLVTIPPNGIKVKKYQRTTRTPISNCHQSFIFSIGPVYSSNVILFLIQLLAVSLSRQCFDTLKLNFYKRETNCLRNVLLVV